MPFNSRNSLLLFFIFLVAFAASFFKIADLDFWWHLKTGGLLLAEKKFPHTDVYSFTAFGREYIDHEWLFQVIQYFIFDNLGAAGIIFTKCTVIAFVYVIVARFLLKNGISAFCALGILLLSIGASRIRFIERPEIFSILFLVISYVLIDGFLKRKLNKSIFWLLPITVVWANLHAAVILGLLLQMAFIGAMILERWIRGSYPTYYDADRNQLICLSAIFIGSVVLTGLNPYGFRVLTVPFELTAIIDSGILQNQEWQQPSPVHLPLFYLCIVLTLLLNVIHFRKLHIVNFLLAAFFGYISLKYVRNVGIFCMMMPLLITPYLGVFSSKEYAARAVSVFGILALLFVVFTDDIFEVGIGKASYFPEKIVDFTTLNNLQGNMLNSYGFGGYLIWTLYPERKIFIDGRNEVYLPLLKKLKESVADSREWRKILTEYRIEYALLNYVDQLEVVTVIEAENQSRITYAAFTSTHFPRKDWALIYWDDTGMILIRRQGINQDLLSQEYTSVFPEGIQHGYFYQEALARSGKLEKETAIQELERKLKEDPTCSRARSLMRAMKALQ